MGHHTTNLLSLAQFLALEDLGHGGLEAKQDIGLGLQVYLRSCSDALPFGANALCQVDSVIFLILCRTDTSNAVDSSKQESKNSPQG